MAFSGIVKVKTSVYDSWLGIYGITGSGGPPIKVAHSISVWGTDPATILLSPIWNSICVGWLKSTDNCPLTDSSQAISEDKLFFWHEVKPRKRITPNSIFIFLIIFIFFC